MAKFNSSLVIVTHNLGVVARYAQTIYIMYAGRIVEGGKCKTVFARPRHPYTIGLLRCVPRIDDQARAADWRPSPACPPPWAASTGKCAFLPRCTHATEQCQSEPWPELDEVGERHYVRCYVNPEGAPPVRPDRHAP